MENRKNFFFGTLLVLIGAAFIYFAYINQKKSETNPSENNHSVPDSMAHSNHEALPSEIGSKPKVNPKDGSLKIVEEFIKSNAKNPASFQFLEWSEITSEDSYWKVRCKYTGVSSFNAEVTTNAWFYIRNNKVIYTKIISKI